MIDKNLVVYGVEGIKNGCNHYRILQPISKLSESQTIVACASSMLKNIDEQALWTDKADVIVSQCGTSEKYLDYVLDNKGRKKFVLDYDDNIFKVSPYNPSYERHGTKGVVVNYEGKEPFTLWEDGVNGFSTTENKNRLLIFTEMLKNVDLVTTPSAVLSGVFKTYGAKNVKVIKNFLDFNNWYPVKMEKDRYVRIGYQGGWSHYEDWCEISEVLRQVMSENNNVKLVIMGQHYPGSLKGIDKDRIEVHDWTSIEVYPYKFKTLNIDIGIAPLANTEFNTCKSEVKWEEYSSLAIPCIASQIPPYSLAISHGKTGYLAKDKDEWIEYLSLLIQSKDLREEIGQQAYSKVRESYDISKNMDLYERTYKNLFTQELVIV